MQPHPPAKFVRFGQIRLGQNYGKIEAKFGLKCLDLDKISILHPQTHLSPTAMTVGFMRLLFRVFSHR